MTPDPIIDCPPTSADRDVSMPPDPTEVSLELRPSSRLEIVDLRSLLRERHELLLQEFPRTAYCSYHTTAGFVDPPLAERLGYDSESIAEYIRSVQHLFPPHADYRHDQMDLRSELTEHERATEPRNADSHLTFIGSGLTNCLAVPNDADRPVYFVELDGVHKSGRRRRQTTVLGYSDETLVDDRILSVPVSGHPIESLNLADDEVGVFDRIRALVEHHGIRSGRVELTLDPDEEHAALTVNEYETLLMKHDLPEVLRNPLRFVAEKGMRALRNPGAVPHRAIEYAKYDMVFVLNKMLDKLGMNDSFVERLVEKFLAVPASRFLRMKRSVRLLVAGSSEQRTGTIIQGRYQSPILIQWKKSVGGTRDLRLRLIRFE